MSLYNLMLNSANELTRQPSGCMSIRRYSPKLTPSIPHILSTPAPPYPTHTIPTPFHSYPSLPLPLLQLVCMMLHNAIECPLFCNYPKFFYFVHLLSFKKNYSSPHSTRINIYNQCHIVQLIHKLLWTVFTQYYGVPLFYSSPKLFILCPFLVIIARKMYISTQC